MEEQAAELFIKNIRYFLSQTYQSKGYKGSPIKNGSGTKRVPNTGPGSLYKNIDYEIVRDDNNLCEAILIYMEDYWEVVDLGRRKPRRFPPLKAVEEWIRKKPIRFQPINGKMPSIKQQVFLVGRSIASKGINGINFYDNALEKTYEDMIEFLEDGEATRLEELLFEKLSIRASGERYLLE